ncbi:predicted protein [Nematostella vectensis]|uniref:EF-hand domain-containing protein n=1 Tax=Nematostella vectensis TaxID=45351 RepID=A7RRJ4_NEMVE|nr:predicted protein [Nematostella vectensis]|eukprot:XP_001638079.1 predicted protein [Nematostella vectensis]
MSAKSLAKMFDNFSSVEFMEFFHKYDTDAIFLFQSFQVKRKDCFILLSHGVLYGILFPFFLSMLSFRLSNMHNNAGQLVATPKWHAHLFRVFKLSEKIVLSCYHMVCFTAFCFHFSYRCYLSVYRICITIQANWLQHPNGMRIYSGNNYIEEKELDRFVDDLFVRRYGTIWNRYDVNREGSLSTEQLKGFINDSMKGQKLSSKNIGMLVKKTLDAVDKDRSGEVDLEEMARYLKVEDNFLREFNINPGQKLKQNDFSRIWDNYDQDGKGSIKGAELDALIRDVFAKIQGRSPEMDDIEKWKDIIMMFADADGDGAISKEELNIFFAQGLKEAKKRLSDGERDPAPNYTPTEEPPKDTPKKSSSPENSGSSDKKCVIS